MNNCSERLYNGIVKENPTFVLMLGMCPTLAVTTSAGNVVIPEDYHIAIFVLAPGAFFVLAVLTALQNKFKAPSATNGSVPQSRLACGGNCMECTGSSCMSNHEVLETRKRQAEEKALAAKKEAVAKKEAELKAATSKKEN